MKKIFQKYFVVYIVIILVCVSFVGGLLVGRGERKKDEGRVLNFLQQRGQDAYLLKNVDFGLFDEVWKTIKKDYIDKDKLVDSEMFYGALRGVVASLQDPHSMFFDPQEISDFQSELQGLFEGIGAELSSKDNYIVVVAPLAGSPAEKAGIRSGDRILAVDGKNTATLGLDEVVHMIRGKKGTVVKLLIGRDGLNDTKEIEITRDEIKIDSVRWSMKSGNIAYIEMSSFNDNTNSLFDKVIGEILPKNPKGIILDLRNNPGGYFDGAVKVASEWIENGKIVAKESFDGQQNDYKASGLARLQNYKTVVLVNGGSASGAEIVAGALQDYKLATLVGEKTFGKGSVQELIPLSDGSAMKITIAKWLTALGRSIDKEGIAPDVSIVLTKEDYERSRDPQLDKALEILKK